jgi:hypothetical protein
MPPVTSHTARIWGNEFGVWLDSSLARKVVLELST